MEMKIDMITCFYGHLSFGQKIKNRYWKKESIFNSAGQII